MDRRVLAENLKPLVQEFPLPTMNRNRMHSVGAGDLANRLFALQRLKDDSELERRSKPFGRIGRHHQVLSKKAARPSDDVDYSTPTLSPPGPIFGEQCLISIVRL